VVLDETGTSKGFGFIRFGNEIEQQTALTSMQGISGLGGKPIKVKILFSFFHDTVEKQYRYLNIIALSHVFYYGASKA
jgi:RNA recognition motif-containing protein